MELTRLDKLIAGTGLYSRREVKQLIKEGRVLVDGKLPRSGEEKYDAETVCLEVDGQALRYSRFLYVMLHKPAGVLSATEDRRAETVLDLLPEHLQKRELFPVGRLDKDTEGLLLLTDDGELAHRLLSPRYHVDKVYYARVEGQLQPEHCRRFAQGLLLADGLQCMPARLELLSPREALVTVQEGKFHQVKRMLAACGAPVSYLKRLSMGPLQLDESLPKGQWRELTAEELRSLQQACEKSDGDC